MTKTVLSKISIVKRIFPLSVPEIPHIFWYVNICFQTRFQSFFFSPSIQEKIRRIIPENKVGVHLLFISYCMWESITKIHTKMVVLFFYLFFLNSLSMIPLHSRTTNKELNGIILRGPIFGHQRKPREFSKSLNLLRTLLHKFCIHLCMCSIIDYAHTMT